MTNIITADNIHKFLKTPPLESGLYGRHYIFEMSGRTIFEVDIPDNAIIRVTKGNVEVQKNVGDNVQITMTNSESENAGILSGFFNRFSPYRKLHTFHVGGTTGNYLKLQATNLSLAKFIGEVGRGANIIGNASSSHISMGHVGDHLDLRSVQNFGAIAVGSYARIQISGHADIDDLGEHAKIFANSTVITFAGSDAYLVCDGDQNYHGVNPIDLPDDLNPMIHIGLFNPNSIFIAAKMIISDQVHFGRFDTNHKKPDFLKVINGDPHLRGLPKGFQARVINGGLTPKDPTFN